MEQQRLARNSRIRPLNGRLPRTNHEETGTHVTGANYFAGFWMRFWAFLLDLIIVFSLNGLLVYPLLRLVGIGQVTFIFPLATLLSGVVFFLYFAIMTKYYGQTIGKMVFGLRVVTVDGQLLSWQQIFFREGIGRFLHQAFFLFYAIYLTVAFTTKKQGIHDMISDSFVIYER
ncbi:RDD family protein [Bacillus solitudinis]|uniref:RDD family protein n=1 Tax=Bacillus solitudinis TaxID=2014074 RepID=UPI000C24970A|nr:RDD family protein [Bacillus solitudinis]